MSSLHSYPSIFNLGHKLVSNLLTVPVNVEEKIDGSQASFGLNDEGELCFRSKGATLNIDAPERMFEKGVNFVKSIADKLKLGYTYRGEYLRSPKHNTLAYDRIPNNHLIIFDINDGLESYLPYEQKVIEANRLGLETVPLLKTGTVTHEELREILETRSILGGQKIEGVVIKPTNYDLFGIDKRVLMGKFVSELFKEAHSLAWKETSPKSGDILDRLIDTYAVQGRWQKAVQHLADAGELEDSPKDIGKILKEIPVDIKKEEEEAIKEKLFEWAWPHISRGCTKGFPQWYKEYLLKKQFDS